MKGRRFARFVAGTCAVAAMAVGLGTTGVASAAKGSDSGSNQFANLKKIPEPSPCKNDQGVTDTEIKVGGIYPQSGPLGASGFFQQIIDGAQVRFNVANDTKELGNRKITFIPKDDGGDNSRNLSTATDLTEQDKVFGIIAESANGDASAQYLNSKGMPVVGWQLGLPMYGTYPNIFGWANANAKDIQHNYTSRSADVFKKLGAKKIALLGSTQANSAILISQVADAISRTKGLKVVYKNADVPPGTTDFGSYAQGIKDSGADALLTGVDTTGNISLLGALKQAGANLQHIYLTAGYDPRVTGVANFDGALFSIEFKPLETTPAPQGITDFKAAMAKYKPDNPINASAVYGWLSANAFIEGIKAAGVNCPTQKAFINNLRMETGYTASPTGKPEDGWFPPVNFAEVFDKPFQCAYFVQLTNKQFVPQFNGEPVCAKQIIHNGKLEPASAAAATPTTTTTAAK
jgi:branched-chain amino acid transport system substrate-binding protein